MKAIIWFILTISMGLLNAHFISLDLNNGFIDVGLDNPCTNAGLYSPIGEPLDVSDVICVVGGEIYEPWIWATYYLQWTFIVCGIATIGINQYDKRKKK
jgi:hypothetical protein